jgi:hypothetical protein
MFQQAGGESRCFLNAAAVLESSPRRKPWVTEQKQDESPGRAKERWYWDVATIHRGPGWCG